MARIVSSEIIKVKPLISVNTDKGNIFIINFADQTYRFRNRNSHIAVNDHFKDSFKDISLMDSYKVIQFNCAISRSGKALLS